MTGSKSSVHERILRLKRQLEEWSRTGYPPEVELPNSLNKIREWESPDYGIEKVGSKRDFTKTHQDWGDDVKEIEGLLKNLTPKKQAKARVYKSESSRRQIAQTKVREADVLLTKVTGQWHEEREALRKVKQKVEHLEMSNRLLLEKNARLESELSQARKALAARDGAIRLVRSDDGQ